MKTRGRDGREAATSPGTPGAPRSWKRQEGPSPGASGGSSTLGHLDLKCLVSRTGGGWIPVLLSSRLVSFVTKTPRKLIARI